MGITLRKEDEMKPPECFHFFLTDNLGQKTFGTVLSFDEPLEEAVRLEICKGELKDTVKKLWTQKAICILSRFSFMDSFKAVLCRLF
jgi:hypothetical protein